MLRWLNQGKLDLYREPMPDRRLKAYSLVSESQPSPVILAQDVMQSTVVTVEESDPVHQALERMREHSIHHLPVVQDGRLVGLVSDRDLLKHRDKFELPVQSIMTRRLLTAKATSSLWTAAQIMVSERINCVLVIDDDQKLIGILTSLDLLCCMTYQAPVEVWL